MALGSLAILYLIIIVSALALQVLLYKTNTSPKKQGLYYILNLVFSFILSFIVYTSLPSNFINEQRLALLWSGIAIVGFVIRINRKDSNLLSHIMVTIAIVGSLVQLFI